MPNWCSNNMTMTGITPAGKKKIMEWEEFNKNDDFNPQFLEFFYPTPPELTGDDEEGKPRQGWYDWRNKNWGTKWDISDATLNWFADDDDDNDTITGWFHSAWSPPIEFYKYMEETGDFIFEASYYEEGCDFCGFYEDGAENTIQYSELPLDERQTSVLNYLSEWSDEGFDIGSNEVKRGEMLKNNEGILVGLVADIEELTHKTLFEDVVNSPYHRFLEIGNSFYTPILEEADDKVYKLIKFLPAGQERLVDGLVDEDTNFIYLEDV